MSEWNEAVDSGEAASSDPRESRPSFVKDVLDYIEIFVIAVCFVILLFSFGFRLCTVSGPSMENTLYNGEQLIISDLFYTPKDGDVVVFHHLGNLNEPVVKRVIATEGEKVEIDYTSNSMIVTVTATDGSVRILDEPYMYYDQNHIFLRQDAEYVVGEGQVFVMGDNRNHSTDSRSKEIGMVDVRSILGKVLFRVAPLNRFGTVK